MQGGEHHPTVPNHSPLRLGTLNGILSGVSVHLGLSKDQRFSFLHPGDNRPGASCWPVGFAEVGKGAVIMTDGARGNLLAVGIISAIKNAYDWTADQ